MISNILNGNERAPCVLIEDTVAQSGKALLASFICNLCKRVEKVHVICYDMNPQYFQQYIPAEFLDNIAYHDFTEDVLGVFNADGLNVNTSLPRYLNSAPGKPAYHKVAVVIDNMSIPLLHRSASLTCQTLAGLRDTNIQGAEVEQVVSLLHADLHDDHTITLLDHQATTIIKTIPPKLDQFLMATQLLHKRASGKVIKITEHINLSAEYDVCDVTEFKSLSATPTTTATSQPDPTANLTFNLTLTDKEKQARSQTKLPYTYDRGRQDETLGKSVGEGKIFYQPDEADDFDEDDPDDDLDI